MEVGEKNRCWFLLLGVLFLIVWAILAVAPLDRKDWALENVLVILIVPLLVLTRKQLPLSRISYTTIFLFLCLHEVGAYYTYAKVPYDEWFKILTSELHMSLSTALRLLSMAAVSSGVRLVRGPLPKRPIALAGFPSLTHPAHLV